jgi:hypothetical protein
MQMFQMLLNYNTLEAALMMKMICKIFWAATQMTLGKWAQDEAVILPWMEALNTLFVKPLPEASEGLEPAGQPEDVTDRLAWPW